MTSLMPHNLQRTGAALVQALKMGDTNARLLLADFFEEHGMPMSAGWAAPEACNTAIEHLREPLPSEPTCFDIQGDEGDHDVGGVEVVIIRNNEFAQCRYYGPRWRVWIGSWTLKAWLQE